MKNAMDKLREKLLSDGTGEAALISYGKNRRYFTKFPSSAGVLLVTIEEAFLLVDFRYAEAAAKKAEHCKVVEYSSLEESLKNLLKEKKIKVLYLEQENISVSEANRFQSICKEAKTKPVLSSSLDDAIKQIRIVKSPDEIAKIEAAQAITDAAFSHVLPYIKEGVSERDIALEIEFFMRRQGADGVAFELIVAAGKNSSMCHAVPSDYKIQPGDFITMDTGALLDGYHSDMTRTVALGEVSKEQKDVYDTVLKAHLAVIAAAGPGEICSQMDKLARDIIDRDYPGRFGHGLGHGVGIEIHEEPRFSKLDDTVCQPGMVITDEPGIYLPDRFGVRIEDMLLITENGCRSLTKSPKELMVL